ncbi:unnamed protein product, partial [Mesorhabditis belari]|uniref:SURF1-like protein n=1 Tax=Mesorhabditis belari TaxID=2138241 RepID=A0AAF3EMX7_9BILA
MIRSARLLAQNGHINSTESQVLTLGLKRQDNSKQQSQTKRGNYKGPRRIRWSPGAIGLLSIPTAAFGLGIWQTYRLQWKLDLIENMKKKLEEPGVAFPIDELEKLLDMEYRRVIITGEFLNDREFVITPRGRFDKLYKQKDAGSLLSDSQSSSHGAHVITPFKIKGSNLVILVNRGWVPSLYAKHATRLKTDVKGETTIEAIVRKTEPRPQFMQNNQLDKDVWYYRNHEEMAERYGTAPIFVDAVLESSVPRGPIGGQTNIRLRNDHLQYLCTWFTLCVVTIFGRSTMSQDEPVVAPIYMGMREDIEMLLQRFVEKGSPRMTDFAKLFKEVQFSKIFAGRIAPPELVEFSERLLQMAASYMHPFRLAVAPTYSGTDPFDHNHEKQIERTAYDASLTRTMLDRIFGVYLTYALFFLQPSDYVAQLLEITRLQKELIEETHYDTVAALLKLHAHKAFVQIPFTSSYDPVQHKRLQISEEDCSGQSAALTSDRQMSAIERITSDSLLKQLEVLSKASREVDFTKDIDELRGIAIRSQIDMMTNDDTIVISPSKPSRISIREKAYTGNIKHSKNRRYANPENQPGALTLARLADEIGREEDNNGDVEDGPTVIKKTKESSNTVTIDALFDETGDSQKQEIAKFKTELEVLEATPTKKGKAKLKQPKIRDPAFEGHIRKVLAPTALQRSNDRLLEKLKRTMKKNDDEEEE